MAPTGGSPHALEETKRAALNVGAIVAAHDWLDSFGSFVGMVEGDSGNVVVENVSFDDAVEESAANETEFAIDGCGSSTDIGPAAGGVVGKGGVRMLEIGDCNWELLDITIKEGERYVPSQWFTQR